jgi:hypothetical protein
MPALPFHLQSENLCLKSKNLTYSTAKSQRFCSWRLPGSFCLFDGVQSGQLMKSLRHALGTLFSKRGLLAVAVITLALGIGANTAIFSVVSAVLLGPLPCLARCPAFAFLHRIESDSGWGSGYRASHRRNRSRSDSVALYAWDWVQHSLVSQGTPSRVCCSF